MDKEIEVKKLETFRPSWDEYFLLLTEVVSLRATCIRKKVGCILVNKQNEIIGTGYNGVPKGHVHCYDNPCAGAYVPTGTCGNLCEATHAEINAILQCKNVGDIQTIYTTVLPCLDCLQAIMNTGCTRIVYKEKHHHGELTTERWFKHGGELIYLPNVREGWV